MLIDEINEITNARGRDYDHPLPNHLLISLEWSLQDFPYTHNPISVAKKMVGLKLARDRKRTKWDNLRDSMGYVVCIDKMCELYFKIGEFDGLYGDLSDKEKEVLVESLRSMSFCEQYQLLQNCEVYLNESTN